MATPAGALVHGRRFAAGVAVGVAAAGLLGALALRAARDHEGLLRAERTDVVTLRALTGVVEAAGGTGDGVRKGVAAFAAQAPELAAIRVVAFEGISLEASTAAADTGDKAAPRRLDREEKDIFDRGQRIRAAVETNRQEGGARKEEIEIRPLPSGGFGFAAPVELGGNVAGLVDVVTAPVSTRLGFGPGAALAFFLVPVALMLLAWRPLGAHRHLLAAVAVAGVAAAAWLYGGAAVRTLREDRSATEAAVRERMASSGAAATAALSAAGIEAPLDPQAWDADLFRRPLAIVAPSGIDAAKSAASFELEAGVLRRIVAGLAALAVAIALFAGYGQAATLFGILRKHREAYAYVAPAMVGMSILVFVPFLYGIMLSFTDSNLYNTNQPISDIWIGLKNYSAILGDFRVVTRAQDGSWMVNFDNFYYTFFFNVVWTITNVAIGVSVGLVLALILNTKGLALRPIYRVLLIFPWAMPNYITALIWKGMFHQQFGVVNQVLQIVGFHPIAWFDRPFTSFLTALATNGWLSFPFMMVISLGALQSIPSDLYEAARVDGATKWQQFRGITLPSLRPALIPAVILSVIWTFNMFNIIYLVTGGEPGRSTEILITQSYKLAFEKYRYGYAAAYSTVIFAILLMYGWFQNRVSRGTEAA
jgi:arabinogalactan oligomer/maltooligosaccharide transport system permease protein